MTLDPSFIGVAFVRLLAALPTTLSVTFVPVVVGLIIGTLVALVRMRGVPLLSALASAYVTFVRGTPMLTHLLLVYFGMPALMDGLARSLGWHAHSASIPMIAFAYIAFSFTAGAYMSEVVRAGLLAVDRGQMEAALSLGMTRMEGLRHIVMPQAFAAALPNLTNVVIGMLHASTLVFAVSVVDINAKAQIVASTNWRFLEAYLAAAAIYWALSLALERTAAWLERRVHFYRGGGVS